MAISATILAWLDKLAREDQLPSGPLLELGPQDVTAAQPVVEHFLRNRLAEDAAGQAIDRLYVSKSADPRQAEVYRALGYTEYVSLDYGDDRADIQHDLNRPLDLGRRFAAVTNFGTAEHIFEITEVLRTQYRHLEVGGLALFFIPTFGELNHGFYNVHPTLWTDLAVANAMELADFHYVDDVARRNAEIEATGTCGFDFTSFPIRPLGNQYGTLYQKVAVNFLRNTGEHMKAAPPGKWPQSVLDCCMLALRRTAESPAELQIPPQALYAPDDIKQAASNLRTVQRPASAVSGAR